MIKTLSLLRQTSTNVTVVLVRTVERASMQLTGSRVPAHRDTPDCYAKQVIWLYYTSYKYPLLC